VNTIKITTTTTTSIDFGPKQLHNPRKELRNHSAIQATTYRHNSKPLEWCDIFKMRTTIVNSFTLLFLFGGIEIMKKKCNARECVKDFSVLFHRTTLGKTINTNKKHGREHASLKRKKMACD
jgi:hypothetical protein